MNKALAKLIINMAEIDQDARFNSNNKFIIYSVDAANEFRIIKIIEKNGYPTKSIIGEAALEKFWLLIQHMDFNIDLQKSCLENCDFAPKQYAHLYDRVQVNSDLNQKFGTQQNKLIINLEETNKEREKIGLASLEEYIKDFNKGDDLGRVLDLKINDDGSAEYLM